MSLSIAERNRQNAQASTGPKTEEGKAASSQNARTHGLNSAKLFIPEDAADEFLSLNKALFAEIRPVGELQMQFFEQLLHASWNTNIARRLLADAFEQLDEKKIASANRYVAQYERSFARALKEIKTLQTDLALRAIEENEPIADLPLTCQIQVLGNEATKIARLVPLTTGATERSQRATHRWYTLARIGDSFRPQTAETTPMPDAA
jgi:hypothetical protein